MLQPCAQLFSKPAEQPLFLCRRESHGNGREIDRVGKALDNGTILDDDNVSPGQCQPPLVNAHLQFSFNADDGGSEGESERERKLGWENIVVANINRLPYSHARFPGAKASELNSRDLSWKHVVDFSPKVDICTDFGKNLIGKASYLTLFADNR